MTDHTSTPSTATGPALRHAVQHFAVSTGVTVDPAAMAAALRTGDLADDIRIALAFHLHEAEPAEIADLIIEGSASASGLKRLARSLLPAGHRTRLYVERFR